MFITFMPINPARHRDSAAAAAGLCIVAMLSDMDYRTARTHAHHCSAVAFGRNDIFVQHPPTFATQAQLSTPRSTATVRYSLWSGGMPQWIDGIADTNRIATRDSNGVDRPSGMPLRVA